MLYAIAALVVILDQLLKWTVRSHVALHQGIPVWPPYIYIEYIQNPGGAFSILPNFKFVFWIVALAVIVAVIYVDRRYRPGWWTRIGLALLLGGAIGNLIDRLVLGWVTDYVYLAFINFPVFNLADVCIDAGVIMLLLRSFRSDRPAGKEEK
jgi:signal peptidase II